MAKIRLDKYLADMQIGTRSAVKEYIRKGRVRVNEAVVKSPEQKIDTETDTVLYDDKPVGYHTYEYFMLNKPQGVVSATQDTKEKTVTELITEKNRKDLFPVGRLDKDTEGLLLITNDGALSHELLSPKKHVDKTYFAEVMGKIGQAEVIKFIVIDGLFLIFYLSMVRRMKAEMLWETSVACWLESGIRKVFARQKTTVRVLLLFAGHMAVCFVLAVGAFYYQSMIALVLLLLFSSGECYMILRKAVEQYQIRLGVEKIRDGALSGKIDIEQLHGEEKSLAEAINNIGEGLLHAVDDSTKNERMKADLITNVSHDIKTPLTSIINYVNLMKLEKIDNERVQGYIKILDEKSQRLKQLTADLVEASKISSGNVKLDMQVIDLVELVYQTSGEFNEKFEQKELTIVTKLPKTAVLIRADGRQLYRVIENLYNNVAKYALEKTRVYVDIAYVEEKVVFSIKNVSEHSLARENSNAGDLTERFIRGDSSRTTEGSGLGLSIAKSLTVLMGGVFDIKVDGDLFKASITFPQYVDENSSNPKMEEPASEDDYEIEELEPEERTEKE